MLAFEAVMWCTFLTTHSSFSRVERSYKFDSFSSWRKICSLIRMYFCELTKDVS